MNCRDGRDFSALPFDVALRSRFVFRCRDFSFLNCRDVRDFFELSRQSMSFVPYRFPPSGLCLSLWGEVGRTVGKGKPGSRPERLDEGSRGGWMKARLPSGIKRRSRNTTRHDAVRL